MTGISNQEALALERISLKDESDLLDLLKSAAKIRHQHFQKEISLCSIINARCGKCGENCAFCAQSSRAKSEISVWPLVSIDEIEAAAQDAAKDVDHFSIVTSGLKVVPGEDLNNIAKALSRIVKSLDIKPCASLGVIETNVLEELKSAGLKRYHHNLESAESFFSDICGSRPYREQIRAVENAKLAGLPVCSGGIFGLGESWRQRVELLETLRNLEVDSVPINFLVPIPGTILENQQILKPFECLKIVAMARLMLPDKTIRICGGRESALRDYQSLLPMAGANGMMVGGYLTVKGRGVPEDLAMLNDAGFHWRKKS